MADAPMTWREAFFGPRGYREPWAWLLLGAWGAAIVFVVAGVTGGISARFMGAGGMVGRLLAVVHPVVFVFLLIRSTDEVKDALDHQEAHKEHQHRPPDDSRPGGDDPGNKDHRDGTDHDDHQPAESRYFRFERIAERDSAHADQMM